MTRVRERVSTSNSATSRYAHLDEESSFADFRGNALEIFFIDFFSRVARFVRGVDALLVGRLF